MVKLRAAEKIRDVASNHLGGVMKPEDKTEASKKIAEKLHQVSDNGEIYKREASKIMSDVIDEYSESGMIVNAAAFQVIFDRIFQE